MKLVNFNDLHWKLANRKYLQTKYAVKKEIYNCRVTKPSYALWRHTELLTRNYKNYKILELLTRIK